MNICVPQCGHLSSQFKTEIYEVLLSTALNHFTLKVLILSLSHFMIAKGALLNAKIVFLIFARKHNPEKLSSLLMICHMHVRVHIIPI